ncbi:MAG TPA: SDR family oxidoreductase [Microthrixaceae bacterium]|nr:SDR family oxidoreductase [Microthrixaceae bacterium]HMT23264.1 SDR family oxidoreductase [Microthrixaceae bacterium]HMT62346.1 SDR family oxidoreductase [Microthrixaceae bacterium]
MKVLLTGCDGYIGVRMGNVLLERGHDVSGLDSGFHRVGWLYESAERRPQVITRDTRAVTVDDLRGYDALVHLAEVSNDPVGELNQDVTYKINHEGSLRLAKLAKEAGIERFIHMSSCSVYGAAGEQPSREGDPTVPLTSYAKCKVLIEQEVSPLADDTFSPTFMRNATAYGASPRQRFDLVVNDLAAGAFLNKEIRMASDGTPWRPFVHILDISHAVACVLDAPRDVIHNEIFNVGSDRSNYQVRQIAEIIGDLVPGCNVVFGDSSADKRNYRADFTKIHEQLPGFECAWDVERGAKDLLDIFERIGFNEELYQFRGHTRIRQIKHLLDTAQIDDDFFWL